MMTRAMILVLALALPASAWAATAPASSFTVDRSVLIASTSPANAYAAGGSVTVTAPAQKDLSVFSASAVVAAPVSGDLLLISGTGSLRSAVGGDVRAAAGTLSIDDVISGDLAAIAGSMHVGGHVKGSVFLAGATIALTGGASGPVVIYGNAVTLGGDFSSDVRVTAAASVTLLPGTHISGTLSYQAPETATIPESVSVDGGVTYTGSSVLPTQSQTRALALAGFGVFLLARILAALLLAGLLAGLFPRLAERFTQVSAEGRPRGIFLRILLGFAVVVATPVFLILLSLTFIGFGIALLVGLLYGLLLLLSFAYAGILLGALIARRFVRRDTVVWRDGVIGMLVLSLLWLIPYLGTLFVLLLGAYTAGALLLIFFHFAFPHEEETAEML